MASYQDMEVRLGVVERKLDLVMRCASVQKRTPSTLMPGEFITETITMEQLYKELSNSGDELVPVK
jgi:hypothetical protein